MLSLRVVGTLEEAKMGMFGESSLFLRKGGVGVWDGRGEGRLSLGSSQVRAKHHLLEDSSLMRCHPGQLGQCATSNPHKGVKCVSGERSVEHATV